MQRVPWPKGRLDMSRDSRRLLLCVAATLLFATTLPSPARAQTISFVTERDFPTGGYDPASVAVRGFNGDGKLDLAAANYNSKSVALLLGNGDRTLQAPRTVAVGLPPALIVVGHLNGDRNLDLAVANVKCNAVSV